MCVELERRALGGRVGTSLAVVGLGRSPTASSIVANVASALEAEAAVRAGADGIGLVRTELLFLGRSTPPSVGEQRATYARILEVMGDRPVVFRTLDVGGDKPAEWQSAARRGQSGARRARAAAGAAAAGPPGRPVLRRSSRRRLVASSG